MLTKDVEEDADVRQRGHPARGDRRARRAGAPDAATTHFSREDLADRLPALLTGAGCSDVAELDRIRTALMPIACIRGRQPGG
ncbi:hypothetical protein AB3662_28385 [Sorangium cellulosum]|uniref:hypothetical protein n=1 Tax=Sorangium cellulosum TaxID=56 RepID=UPI003D9A89B9